LQDWQKLWNTQGDKILKNILAIGTAANNIVQQLSQYPVYQCYYISNEIEKTSKFKFALPLKETPEDYESLDMKKMHSWLNKITKSCTVMINGASESSAITLRALEHLHKKKVKMNIVYFMPEIEVLSENKILLERSVRGILQNFARSGLFEGISLVSNVMLEKLAGPTNVIDYYDQINHVFTSTYYMLDVFKNTKPTTSTFKKPKESCRISTIGISSTEEQENLFFPFQDEVEVIYYYGINEERLKTEENLFRKITDKIKSKITEERKVSFGIYPTQYENDYIYVEMFSPKIQQEEK
jgi:hypothetical protein